MVRGKFRCDKVAFLGDHRDPKVNREFTFHAVYDTSTPENQRFSAATPYAKLEMHVSNPEVQFTPGVEYYLDFTPVETIPA